MQKSYNFDPSRLCAAYRWDWRVLEIPRRSMVDAIKRIAGPYYSRGTVDRERPINYAGLYTQIMSRNLAANAPRYMCSSFDRAATLACTIMQQDLNDEMKRMRAEEIFQKIALDTLVFAGYIKVHLADACDSLVQNWGFDAGEAVISRIAPGDMCFSTDYTDWRDIEYSAHRYYMPISLARERFKKGTDLVPVTKKQFNPTGEQASASVLAGDYYNRYEGIEDIGQFVEFYVPRWKAIITFQTHDGGYPAPEKDGQPLEEKGWTGPDHGSIMQIGMGHVPDQILPRAPIQDILSLDEAGNECQRKMFNVMTDMKELTFVASTEEGEEINRANHGTTVVVKDPKNISQYVSGGKTLQALQAFMMTVEKGVDYVGGNLQLLGGRGQQANTLGQERIINANGSAQMEYMSDQMSRGIQWAGESMGWFNWYHPFRVAKSKYQVAGNRDLWATQSLHPFNPQAPNFRSLVAQGADMRRGPMPAIKFDPYSVRPQTPEQRASIMMEFLQNFYVPLSQLFQAKGIDCDLDFIVRKFAELHDNPDLGQAFITSQPPADNGNAGKSHEGTMQPGSTQRNYNRTNTSEATPGGDREAMLQQFAGADMGSEGQAA